MTEFINPSAAQQLNNAISKREEERKENVRKELQEAKAAASNKEPFSIEKLAQMYDLTNDHGQSLITPELIEDLEIQYYLNNPTINTLEDFAKHRQELDGHNVG